MYGKVVFSKKWSKSGFRSFQRFENVAKAFFLFSLGPLFIKKLFFFPKFSKKGCIFTFSFFEEMKENENVAENFSSLFRYFRRPKSGPKRRSSETQNSKILTWLLGPIFCLLVSRRFSKFGLFFIGIRKKKKKFKKNLCFIKS